MGLTLKQQTFCNEYLLDFNATASAIRAGYSKQTASSQASRLLSNVKVQEFLAGKKTELSIKTDLTQEWIIQELKEVLSKCKEGSKYNVTGATRALEVLARFVPEGQQIEDNKITVRFV
jgi:phage terminase small subunit